jgi:predicted Zn-dependent protease
MLRKRSSYLLSLSGLLLLSTSLITASILTGCSEDGGFNLFSVSQDKQLGLQLKQEIESNPQEYPVLSETQYASVYTYANGVKNRLLNTGLVALRDSFNWELKIIRNDTVLNAFCAPGGYIYFYTGILKYLDKESEFAGVMGHEIAHAALRHSTEQMTRQYGFNLLLQVLLGENQGALAQIAAGLTLLRFSRGNETESDNASVKYLCATNLDATGTAGFFQKLVAQGGQRTPQFLSTHPDPGNRVANIQAQAQQLNCTGTATNQQAYQAMLAQLP